MELSNNKCVQKKKKACGTAQQFKLNGGPRSRGVKSANSAAADLLSSASQTSQDI